MGTYGTFSGWIRWFDNDNEEGLLLGLKNGDVRIRGTADGTFEVLDADGVVVGLLNEDGITAVRGALAGMTLEVTGMVRERTLRYSPYADGGAACSADSQFVYTAGETGLIQRYDRSDPTGEPDRIVIDTNKKDFNDFWIDGGERYLYAVTDDSLYKIDLSSFTYESAGPYGGTLVIGAGEYVYTAEQTLLFRHSIEPFAFIDYLQPGGIAEQIEGLEVSGAELYAGLTPSPGKIAKIDLTTFTVTATLTLAAGENYVNALKIEGGYLYAACKTIPGKIVKIDLSTFTATSTLTLNSGENSPKDFACDSTYLYVSTGSIVRITLASFTRTDALALSSERLFYRDDYLFAARQTSLRFIPIATFVSESTSLYATASVTAHEDMVLASDGYLYLCGRDTVSGDPVARITKVNLQTWSVEDTLAVSYGSALTPNSMTADDTYLYIGDLSRRIHRVALTSFAYVDTVTVSVNPAQIRDMLVIGTTLYAAVWTTSGATRIIKIDTASFTETVTLNLSSTTSDYLRLSTYGGYLYVTHYLSPAKITKVELAGFTESAILTLSAGEQYPKSSAIDTTGSFMYVGCDDQKIVKIQLSGFTRIGVLSLGGSGYVVGLAVDTVSLYACLSTVDDYDAIEIGLDTFAEVSRVTGDENTQAADILLGGDGYLYVCLGALTLVAIKVQSATLGPLPGNGFAFIDENGTPVIAFNAEDLLTIGSDTLAVLLNALSLSVDAPVTFKQQVRALGGVSTHTIGAAFMGLTAGFKLYGGVGNMDGHRLLNAVLDLPVLDADPDSPVDGEVWLRAVVDTTTVWPGLPFLPGIVTAGGAPELRAYVDSVTYKVALSAV